MAPYQRQSQTHPSQFGPPATIRKDENSGTSIALQPSLHWEASHGDVDPKGVTNFLEFAHQGCIAERSLDGFQRIAGHLQGHWRLHVWNLPPSVQSTDTSLLVH